MEETKTNEEQQNFRINIKQTAKGFSYFDVTVRGQDEVELTARLKTALDVAKTTCEKLNKEVQ